MKRWIAFLLCLLLLTGCGAKVMPHAKKPVEAASDQPEEIWMEVAEDSVAPSGITFVVHNQSAYRISYSSDIYSLEVKDGEDWYTVLPKGSGWIVSQLIPVDVDGGCASEPCSIDLSALYDDLLPGRYRLVKDTTMYGEVAELGPRNLYGHLKTEFRLAGEFEIEA